MMSTFNEFNRISSMFVGSHHGHDHGDSVGAEPGQGVARHLFDGGEEEEDGDEHHHHAHGEEGDVQARDHVAVPDAADVQG